MRKSGSLALAIAVAALGSCDFTAEPNSAPGPDAQIAVVFDFQCDPYASAGTIPHVSLGSANGEAGSDPCGNSYVTKIASLTKPETQFRAVVAPRTADTRDFEGPSMTAPDDVRFCLYSNESDLELQLEECGQRFPLLFVRGQVWKEGHDRVQFERHGGNWMLQDSSKIRGSTLYRTSVQRLAHRLAPDRYHYFVPMVGRGRGPALAWIASERDELMLLVCVPESVDSPSAIRSCLHQFERLR